MDLKEIRAEYLQDELDIKDLDSNPINQLQQWFNEALDSEILYPNAANLCTVDANNFPHSRIILIKDINDAGITFFTDYSSDKARNIEINPNVCLNIFWKEFDRQVRINGHVKKVDRKVSEQYFQSRPKESQISATASSQSNRVDKEHLIKKVNELNKKYEHQNILPCPEDWGGYILAYNEFEFWQGRPSRLHDRFKYKFDNSKWDIYRVAP
jgi:pyridoxamine 5'-phosphate oxidase